MERYNVAQLQQFIKRNVIGSGLGTPVIGQYPAAETSQPVHDCCADASCSDYPDGQVAQFSPAYIIQSVIMNICTADDGSCISHRHQHQHQCVIGHAVGRIGDVFNGNADALRVLHIDMVISNASCGDVRYAGAAKREKSGICDLSLVADADASVSECQLNIGFRYRCLCDSWHYAKARRHLPEQNGLVLPASVNRDSRCWDGRGGRGRQRSGAAGHCSCWFAVGHAPSQGSVVLPARMWFSICRRYATGRHHRSMREPEGEASGERCGASSSPPVPWPCGDARHAGLDQAASAKGGGGFGR